MTDSAVATILEGEGYHTFRGPRPIAWDQIYLMLTGNVAKYVHTLAACSVLLMMMMMIIIIIIFMRS